MNNKEMPNENLRLKLKATIEAKRISRMGQDTAHEKLEEFKKVLKKMENGPSKEKMEIMISVLHAELEKNEETYANAEYGGTIEGGCGFGSGGGSGTDAG